MHTFLITKASKLYQAWNVAAFLLVLGISFMLYPQPVHAAAGGCTTPSTDYGQVSYTSANNNAVTVASTGTYYVWTRMSAPSPASASNVYYLDVDGANCFTVGGSQVPVYSSGAATYFTGTNGSSFGSQNGADNSNWINTTGAGTTNSDASTNASASRISVNLTAGTHNLKLIGAAAGVVVDRIILVQESNCVPDNTAAGKYGDNCATSDTTAPTVSVATINGTNATTNPNPNVASPVSVVVSATDNVAVQKVELYVDGASTPIQTDTTVPYSFSGLTLPPGNHYVVAEAYDTNGNMASTAQTSFVVTDTTPPTTAITAPTAGSTQSGTIAVTASASDDVGVTKVELYADGTLKQTDTTAPYSFSLDTTTLSNTSHGLTVKAYDAAGHVTTSSAVAITVSNTAGVGDTTPPTIAIATPLANTIIAGKSYVFAPIITDASGLKQVVFQVDGTTVATDTAAPFSYTFDTSTLAAGSHTLGVKATDNSTAQNTNPSFTTVTVRVTSLADVDRNCKINFSDINSIIPRIGVTGTGLGVQDVNADNKINFSDINSIIPKLGTQPC